MATSGDQKLAVDIRHNGQYFKRDTTTGRILNGSKNPHKGVVDEK